MRYDSAEISLCFVAHVNNKRIPFLCCFRLISSPLVEISLQVRQSSHSQLDSFRTVDIFVALH